MSASPAEDFAGAGPLANFKRSKAFNATLSQIGDSQTRDTFKETR